MRLRRHRHAPRGTERARPNYELIARLEFECGLSETEPAGPPPSFERAALEIKVLQLQRNARWWGGEG